MRSASKLYEAKRFRDSDSLTPDNCEVINAPSRAVVKVETDDDATPKKQPAKGNSSSHLVVLMIENDRTGLKETGCRPQSLSRHGPWILVWSHAHEFDVADVIGIGPLQKIEVRDKLRPNPDALSHLFSGESLAPSATVRFRQI